MLPTPTPFATNTTTTTTYNNVPGDFLDLSFDENPLGLNALSSTFSWNDLDRSPLNVSPNPNHADAQVRNGQPTPPPFEEKSTITEEGHGTGDLYTLFPGPPAGQKRRNQAKQRKSQKAPGLSRREKSLERNRVAASKCRQKKKEYTALLETQFKVQWQKKSQLDGELSSLRCQTLGLKNEVLRHAHCGDGRVKEHLTQMMQQIMHLAQGKGLEEGVSSVSPPSANPTTTSPPQLPELGFNLEDAELLDEDVRRGSKASINSDSPFSLLMDDNFDELINAQ